MDAWLGRNKGYLALSFFYAIVLGTVLLWRQPAPAPIAIVEPSPRPTRTPAQVVVHVTGAVLRPDVYTLPEASRLKDALLAAGGPLVTADLASLNLATLLRDGQQVQVPFQGQAVAPFTTAPLAPAAPSGGLLDLNTASAAELEGLPGIGPVLAQRIVEDRQANGPYATVEELERVRGIGPVLLEKIRPLVVAP